MSFGIKPLADRVVIKKLEAEEKTESGKTAGCRGNRSRTGN